jgi:hypothetical protein
MAGCPCPFAGSGLGLSGPVPVSATFSAPPGLLVSITFSEDLAPGAFPTVVPILDASNPGAQLFWTPSSVPTVVGAVLSYTAIAAGAAPGPDTITYAPPPFDLVSKDTGIAVMPFTIPVSIIP